MSQRQKLNILGKGNCAYNAMAVAICFQFETEGENGYWHEWLKSANADYFWTIFNANIENENRITEFKKFISVTTWTDRQNYLAKCLREWNADLMQMKLGENENFRKAMAKSHETFFKQTILESLNKLPELRKNETYFGVIKNRIADKLERVYGISLAVSMANLLDDQAEKLTPSLNMLFQKQQQLFDNDVLFYDENEFEKYTQLTNEASDISFDIIIKGVTEKAINWFDDAKNATQLLVGFSQEGLHVGTDELIFLAEATGSNLKLSGDGVKLDNINTIYNNYIPDQSAPLIVLKQEGAHWNLWVDNNPKLIETYKQETEVKQEKYEDLYFFNQQTQEVKQDKFEEFNFFEDFGFSLNDESNQKKEENKSETKEELKSLTMPLIHTTSKKLSVDVSTSTEEKDAWAEIKTKVEVQPEVNMTLPENKLKYVNYDATLFSLKTLKNVSVDKLLSEAKFEEAKSVIVSIPNQIDLDREVAKKLQEEEDLKLALQYQNESNDFELAKQLQEEEKRNFKRKY